MAWCYYYGKGVNKNWKKCFELYEKAADLGDFDALAELGYNYKYGVGDKCRAVGDYPVFINFRQNFNSAPLLDKYNVKMYNGFCKQYR